MTVTSPVANLRNSSSSRSKQVIVAVLGIVEGCRAILALLLLHFGGAGNSMQYMESSPSRYRWIITNQPTFLPGAGKSCTGQEFLVAGNPN